MKWRLHAYATAHVHVHVAICMVYAYARNGAVLANSSQHTSTVVGAYSSDARYMRVLVLVGSWYRYPPRLLYQYRWELLSEPAITVAPPDGIGGAYPGTNTAAAHFFFFYAILIGPSFGRVPTRTPTVGSELERIAKDNQAHRCVHMKSSDTYVSRH